MDRRKSAAAQVYESLRAKIVSLEFEPGAGLSRTQLAKLFKVSLTPVRDAFNLLDKEGLVEIYPQSKTLVSRINIDHARETQFLRRAFEIEVARALAAAPDKSALDEARAILASQRLALREAGRLEWFRDLDYRLHTALARAAGQSNIWQLIVARSGHIDRLRNLHLPDAGKAAKILADHERIVAALEASDEAGAADAVRAHLSDTLGSMPSIVGRYPDYF